MNSSDSQTKFQQGSVYGCLHSPGDAEQLGGVVLTHGAGSDYLAPVLIAVAQTLCAAGFVVLRCNLAFRQRRPNGPPHPSTAAADRQSLREAMSVMRTLASGKFILGGHSYGGRQATMLAADDSSVADSLLLLSYPLHPPAKAESLRTAHFPKLSVPSLFVHGSSDPFGTEEEMKAALNQIPAATKLSIVPGAGHDLKRGKFDLQHLLVDLVF